MRLSIGVAQDRDPTKAAAEVAKSVKDPDLTLAVGRVRLDQRRVHRGLCAERAAAKLLPQLDPELNPAEPVCEAVENVLVEVERKEPSIKGRTQAVVAYECRPA